MPRDAEDPGAQVGFIVERDEAAAAALAQAVVAALRPLGVASIRELDLMLDVGHSGISQEHFGFAVNGLSQPEPYDETGAVLLEGRPVTTPKRVQGVPLGEFLMGYVNGHHEPRRQPAEPQQAGRGGAAEPGWLVGSSIRTARTLAEPNFARQDR